jgi:hypothetical protein
MAVITSQKIATYYERFKTIEVTFTKEIIQVTGLIPQQVYLKCVGDFWPCVIYAASFQRAKAVVNIKSGILQKLDKANNMISLRYCFKNLDAGNPVTFFVSAKFSGQAPYGGSQDVALFNLQFTQRPPDDLIEIMGRVLDANVNSAKRREERFLITPDSARKLRLLSKENAVFIQGVPRRCILRDISFSGAKLIMMGIAKFLVNKEAALRLDFEDPRESYLLRGKFIRFELVEGRKDLVALAIQFEESLVPMGYKIRINDFLSQIRTDNRTAEDTSTEARKSPAMKAAGEVLAAQAAIAKAQSAPEASVPEAGEETGAAPAAPAPAAEDFDLNIPGKT